VLFNFDYDGVIVDSFDQLLDLAVQAWRPFSCGRPPTADDFRRIENLTFEDLGRRIGLAENQVSDYVARVFELQKEQWTVEVFPEIIPTFRQLAASHTLVVITASQSEAVAATLEEFGLGDCVSTVLGGELGTTKAERISQSRETHSFAVSDTFMVGDAISDIRQGKAAGVKTIAVTWGFQDRELLEKESPDFIIDLPTDLLKVEAGCI
jgi:phosphoglycolate phosphatase